MIYFVNGGLVLHPTTMMPLVKNESLDDYLIQGEQYLDSFKVNSTKVFQTDGADKALPIGLNGLTDKEKYDILTNYDKSTTIAANFSNRSMNAGSISANSSAEIEYLSLQRLGPEDGYKSYVEIARVPYDTKTGHFETRDYILNANAVYLYSIRPVGRDNSFGPLNIKKAALNRYEYDWILQDTNTRICIMDSSISSLTNVSKVGVIETIGSVYPVVNSYSNLKYKTFSYSGIAEVVTDVDKSVRKQVTEAVYGTDPQVKTLIAAEYKKNFPEYSARIDDKVFNLDEIFSNNMALDLNYEREYRERVMDMLNDGKPKLFKTATEGLMYVKLYNVVLTPKQELGRYVYSFSCNVVQVGDVTEDVISNFIYTKNLAEV